MRSPMMNILFLRIRYAIAFIYKEHMLSLGAEIALRGQEISKIV